MCLCQKSNGIIYRSEVKIRIKRIHHWFVTKSEPFFSSSRCSMKIPFRWWRKERLYLAVFNVSDLSMSSMDLSPIKDQLTHNAYRCVYPLWISLCWTRSPPLSIQYVYWNICNIPFMFSWSNTYIFENKCCTIF